MLESELVDGAVLDFEELLNRVDGHQALVAELIEIFREDSPGLIAEMEKGLVAGDAKTVRHSAHSFKGLILNFGKSKIAQELGHIECFAGSGDLELSAQHFARFKPMHDRLLVASSRYNQLPISESGCSGQESTA